MEVSGQLHHHSSEGQQKQDSICMNYFEPTEFIKSKNLPVWSVNMWCWRKSRTVL